MMISINRQRLYLILIMVLVAIGVGGTSIRILYNEAYEWQKKHLRHMVHSQAHLLEAVGKFDSKYSKDFPGGPRAATLSQYLESNKHLAGFGKTGEFLMAEMRGEQIVFLSKNTNEKLSSISPLTSIKLDSDLAEPMRRALQGKAGIMEGLDYRGTKVLAAYEPVNFLNVGLVGLPHSFVPLFKLVFPPLALLFQVLEVDSSVNYVV